MRTVEMVAAFLVRYYNITVTVIGEQTKQRIMDVIYDVLLA